MYVTVILDHEALRCCGVKAGGAAHPLAGDQECCRRAKLAHVPELDHAVHRPCSASASQLLGACFHSAGQSQPGWPLDRLAGLLRQSGVASL